MSWETLRQDVKEIFAVITKLKRVNARLINRKLARLEISHEQWVVLRTIYLNKPLSAREIAELAGKGNSTMTRLLDQLEKKEIIERCRDKKDRRVITLHISENGKEVARSATVLENELQNQATYNINLEEIEVASTLFKKILATFERLDKEGQV